MPAHSNRSRAQLGKHGKATKARAGSDDPAADPNSSAAGGAAARSRAHCDRPNKKAKTPGGKDLAANAKRAREPAGADQLPGTEHDQREPVSLSGQQPEQMTTKAQKRVDHQTLASNVADADPMAVGWRGARC